VHGALGVETGRPKCVEHVVSTARRHARDVGLAGSGFATRWENPYV
jgi:hypothetical protein